MKYTARWSNFFSLFKNNINELFYVIIVIILWAVAIWDISKILREYISDNKYTYVKSDAVLDNNAPFLEDMEFCVRYQNSLFEQRWFNESENVNKSDYEWSSWSDMSMAHKFIKNLNFSKMEDGILSLTNQEMIFAAKYLYQIQMLDDRFLLAGAKNLSDDYRIWKSNPIVDVALATEKQLEMIQKSFHHWVKGSFNNYPYVNVTYFNPTSVCYYYKIRDAFAQAKNNKLTLPLGIIHPNKDIASKALAKTKIFMTETYPINNLFDVARGESDKTTVELRVNLKNIGIYDKREVSDDCYQEQDLPGILPIKTSDINFWPSCKARIYVQAMQEFCSCIPFTLRSLTKNTNKPFCTFENYNSSCFNNVRDNVSKMPCFDQCITVKNNYNFDRYFLDGYPNSNSSVDSDLKSNGWYSQTVITIFIADMAYSVYQEKFKVSFAQLVAQVGGDIGLYTGFSMMALWQFLVYLYNHNQENKRKLKSEVKVNKESTESWFEVIMCYLETRGCKYNQSEAMDKENLQKEIQEEKENSEKLQKELKEMKDNFLKEILMELKQQSDLHKKFEEEKENFQKLLHDKNSKQSDLQKEVEELSDSVKQLMKLLTNGEKNNQLKSESETNNYLH